jgi:hypothetical protein
MKRMRILLVLGIGSGMLLTAASLSPDMRRAIAWEHYKDVAAARQARIEARHPTVTYGEANRDAEEQVTHDRRVVDPGPPAWRKDHPGGR